MSASDFAVPIGERYFEDFPPGAVYEFGHSESAKPTSSTSPAASTRSRCISTEASRGTGPIRRADRQRLAHRRMMMRLFVDHFLPGQASLASPGIDELRWTRPVRPGDVLHLRVTVLEATRSRSKPDRGMVRTLIEVLNQNGETVMSLKPMNLLRCRPPDRETPA